MGVSSADKAKKRSKRLRHSERCGWGAETCKLVPGKAIRSIAIAPFLAVEIDETVNCADKVPAFDVSRMTSSTFLSTRRIRFNELRNHELFLEPEIWRNPGAFSLGISALETEGFFWIPH